VYTKAYTYTYVQSMHRCILSHTCIHQGVCWRGIYIFIYIYWHAYVDTKAYAYTYVHSKHRPMYTCTDMHHQGVCWGTCIEICLFLIYLICINWNTFVYAYPSRICICGSHIPQIFYIHKLKHIRIYILDI